MNINVVRVTSGTPAHTTVEVALGGELDMASAERIEPALTRLVYSGEQELVLELSNVTFCDSAGAELFERVNRRCTAAHVRLRLRNIGGRTALVLRALGVDRTISCAFSSPASRGGGGRRHGPREPSREARPALARQQYPGDVGR
ncbi:STAS domain-containing protein [Streptomyces xantholiticus]|uniref:STAS domain-containing protein n=1 Tax=Streptomyces xantholiticus TaxID=68285 RepID=A0ABV1UNP9_9ACTN